MEWTLRDLFVAYVEHLKQAARKTYDLDLLVWATLAAGGAKIKRPDPPAILGAPKIVIGG
jgi:hypothetical protein